MIESGAILHYVSVIAPSTAQKPLCTAQSARLQAMIAADYKAIWRLLRRLGLSAERAEDAAQQVFLIIAERLDAVRPGSERAFAFGTALRVAQSSRRAFARERMSVDIGELRALHSDPEASAHQRREIARLDAVLDALPHELRSVFVLFELSGFTSPEIAEMTGLPLGTVASRLRRAREAFQARLRVAAPAEQNGGAA